MINVIKKVKNIGMYAFLILVTFISVFPLYWMVSASTNKSVDVSKGVLSLGSHLGENLKNLLANQDVGAALVNSFKYAILLTIVSMVICSLAGYGFEIYHDKANGCDSSCNDGSIYYDIGPIVSDGCKNENVK